MEINITYDLLFDILRNEKSRDDLQKIDDAFYNNVVEYLKTKESFINDMNSPVVERERTRIQVANVRKILTEIYERREKKIINLATYFVKTNSTMVDTSALLGQEKGLFDSLVGVFSNYRKGILDNVMNHKSPSEISLIANENSSQKKESVSVSEYKSVRFVSPIPRFLGPELETYGPFDQDDIASLPSKIADILIQKDRAEELNIN